MLETTILILEIIALAFIAGLIVYKAYRTGHMSGFDAGARSDVRGFYPPQAARQGGCVNHECLERDGCACYVRVDSGK